MGKLAALVAVAAAAAFPSAAVAGTATHLGVPPDGQTLIGFTFRLFDTNDPVWGDSRPLAERISDSIQGELAGKTPAFIKVWAPWQRPDEPGSPLVPFSSWADDIAKERTIVGDHGILHLDWNLTLSTYTHGITTHDIKMGKLDHYVRTYARDLRSYGRPILLTLFNGEFNGSWWAGVSPKANGSLTTQDFVDAWRRVVDIFRAVGVGNVSWAWVVNAYPNGVSGHTEIDRNIAAYWPGDDYVDWVGADVYDVGTADWLDGPYSFAVAHGKPMFIGEFGIRHEWSSVPPGQWAPWLNTIFDYFDAHPAIKAISYFNLNNRRGATRVHWDPARSVYLDGGRVNYVPDENDHDSRLVAGGPDVRALFSRRIASPRYVSTISTTSIQTEPLAPTATLLAPTRHAHVVTIHWQGNLAADTFDVQLRRGREKWFTVMSSSRAAMSRVRGIRRFSVRVRVRGRDVDGAPGQWSAPQVIRFP